MNQLSLSVAALIPALLLCWYIYAKDRVEKEPIGLLSLLFGVGAVVYLPAIWCENQLIGLFDQAFAGQMTHSLSGVVTFTSEGALAAHSAACGFVAVALVEEGLKWLLLFLITRRNKNFNCLFDGIVYAVFLSLGFAAVENVRYALMDGWDTFLLRALTSVPGHMTFGVLMGVCYSLWHTYCLAAAEEKQLAAAGRITVTKPFLPLPWLLASFGLPVLTHGFYSFIRFYRSEIMTVVFYVFLVLLYVLCFVVVHRMSAADSADTQTVARLIGRKYTLPDRVDAEEGTDNG